MRALVTSAFASALLPTTTMAEEVRPDQNYQILTDGTCLEANREVRSRLKKGQFSNDPLERALAKELLNNNELIDPQCQRRVFSGGDLGDIGGPEYVQKIVKRHWRRYSAKCRGRLYVRTSTPPSTSRDYKYGGVIEIVDPVISSSYDSKFPTGKLDNLNRPDWVSTFNYDIKLYKGYKRNWSDYYWKSWPNVKIEPRKKGVFVAVDQRFVSLFSITVTEKSGGKLYYSISSSQLPPSEEKTGFTCNDLGPSIIAEAPPLSSDAKLSEGGPQDLRNPQPKIATNSVAKISQRPRYVGEFKGPDEVKRSTMEAWSRITEVCDGKFILLNKNDRFFLKNVEYMRSFLQLSTDFQMKINSFSRNPNKKELEKFPNIDVVWVYNFSFNDRRPWRDIRKRYDGTVFLNQWEMGRTNLNLFRYEVGHSKDGPIELAAATVSGAVKKDYMLDCSQIN